MSTAMSLRLPEKLSKALADLAAKVERPKSSLVRKILQDYVADNSSSRKKLSGGVLPDSKFPPGKIGHALDQFAGTWSAKEEKEFLKSIKIFEKIDKELWK